MRHRRDDVYDLGTRPNGYISEPLGPRQVRTVDLIFFSVLGHITIGQRCGSELGTSSDQAPPPSSIIRVPLYPSEEEDR